MLISAYGGTGDVRTSSRCDSALSFVLLSSAIAGQSGTMQKLGRSQIKALVKVGRKESAVGGV